VASYRPVLRDGGNVRRTFGDIGEALTTCCLHQAAVNVRL
jgi:hypothetical protein